MWSSPRQSRSRYPRAACAAVRGLRSTSPSATSQPHRADLGPGLPDDDAWARGEDVDRDPLLVLLDEDVAEPGMAELAADVVADLDVLDQVLGELLRARVPVGLPLVDYPDPQAAWV